MASTDGQPDAVRHHLVDSAYRVIARDGLVGATTRAIAEEAGVGVGTLYNYFNDRRDLVVAALLRRAHLASEPLHQMASRAGSATVAANLHRAAGEVGAILSDLVPLFAAAFSDVELLEALRRAITSAELPHGPFEVHPLESYLMAERELGRVAADADCRAAASLVLSLCHEGAFLQFLQGTKSAPKAVDDEIDLIAAAISPPGA
jgi:AcrR family transcriptional regulator